MESHPAYSGHSVAAPNALRPVASSLAEPIREASTKGMQKVYDNMAGFQNEMYDRMEYTLDQQRKQYIAETVSDIQAKTTKALSLPDGVKGSWFDDKGVFQDAAYKSFMTEQLARLDGLDKGYLRPDSARSVRSEVAQLKQKLSSSADLKIADSLAPRAKAATLKLAKYQLEQGEYDKATATINGSPDYAMSPFDKEAALAGVFQTEVLDRAKAAVRENDYAAYSAIVSDKVIMDELTTKQQEELYAMEDDFPDTDGSISANLQELDITDSTPIPLPQEGEDVSPSTSTRKKKASQILGLPLGVTDEIVSLYDQMDGNFKDGEAKRQANVALDKFAARLIHPGMTQRDADLFYNVAERLGHNQSEAKGIFDKYNNMFGTYKDFNFQTSLENFKKHKPNFFVPQNLQSLLDNTQKKINALILNAPDPTTSKKDEIARHKEELQQAKNELAELQISKQEEMEKAYENVAGAYAAWLSQQDKQKLTYNQQRMELFNILDKTMDDINGGDDKYTYAKWNFSSSVDYTLAKKDREDEIAAREKAKTKRGILDAETHKVDQARTESAKEEENAEAAAKLVPLPRFSINTSHQASTELGNQNESFLAVPKGSPLAGSSVILNRGSRTRIIPCKEIDGVTSPTFSTRARINLSIPNNAPMDILIGKNGRACLLNNSVPKKEVNMYQFIMANETGSTIAVHHLPAADGGGSYEVAGINEKYHPEEAAKLKQMVRQGASQEDLKQEVFAYYKTITQDAADIIAPATTSKGIELFMRDCAVNHGNDGAQNVLRRALNVPKGTNLTQAAKEYVDKHGTTKLLQALSEARANYYTAILINKPEKQIFKKGWFNRNNNVTRAAFSLLNSH